MSEEATNGRRKDRERVAIDDEMRNRITERKEAYLRELQPQLDALCAASRIRAADLAIYIGPLPEE